MGLYSQNCLRCSHSVLSTMAITFGLNEWMSEAVVITPDNKMISGDYDGYGTVGATGDAIGGDNTVYHTACWEVAGKPRAYAGPSGHSDDQGWFFDEDDYALPDPRTRTSD